MEQTFTILCPTDFSECSLNAIEYASKLGEKYNANLILFHVLNREDYLKLSPGDLEGKFQEEFVLQKLKNLQQTVLDECVPNGLKDCQIAAREGKIVQGILSFAKEINANLIVVGTEGMNDLRENIIGSRSSRLVEQSDRDVLVVPRRVFFKKPKKLVFASDYLEEDKLAIQKVVEWARFFDAEIDLVHISSSQKVIEKALHLTMIEEIKPFVRYEKINFILKSFRDEVALGLENYLHEAKGDILITMSKNKNIFDHIISKNLSKKMSYFLTKPLWVIKSF
ncbi:MAG: universal stress protein [Leptospira sp.]|nr:universal stress protein [Leptospira sp.]